MRHRAMLALLLSLLATLRSAFRTRAELAMVEATFFFGLVGHPSVVRRRQTSARIPPDDDLANDGLGIPLPTHPWKAGRRAKEALALGSELAA